MPLQVRRGPTADRLSITPLNGELIFDTDQNALYVGDGSTPGGVPGSEFTAEDARNVTADLFSNGSHTNISFAYDNINDRINAVVDLTSYTGSINASSFTGDFFADDSTQLIDATLASINLNETIRSDIIPFDNDLYSLGSDQNRFTSLYLSGSDLFLANAQITAVGTTIDLPAGSTVDGVLIGTGNGSGIIEGESYRINIVGDDSALIVDSSAGEIVAPGGITGDLKGSIFADDSSILVDSITNSFFGSFNTSILSINENNIVGDESLNVNIVTTQGLRVVALTDGTFFTNSTFGLRSSRGTINEPLDTLPGDATGKIVFEGYYDDDYKPSATLASSWDNSAVMTDAFPESSLTAITYNGTSTNLFIFDSKGVFTAPVIRVSPFETSNLPTNVEEGSMVFDTTTKEFKGWNGSTWVVLG